MPVLRPTTNDRQECLSYLFLAEYYRKVQQVHHGREGCLHVHGGLRGRVWPDVLNRQDASVGRMKGCPVHFRCETGASRPQILDSHVADRHILNEDSYNGLGIRLWDGQLDWILGEAQG